MQSAQRTQTQVILGAAVLALGLCALSVSAAAQANTAKKAKTASYGFAQKLVESTHAAHPEADEIGISATTQRGCIGIASTDPSDVGEKCEADDIEPMKTGKPSVGKEGDGFDVGLPLHDAHGKLVGVVGIGFKASPGQTEASVTAAAKKIAADMERHIPSKAALLGR
jgi:hypothetical protein